MNVQKISDPSGQFGGILDMILQAANNNPDIDHQAQGKIELGSFDFPHVSKDDVPYDEYESYMQDLADMYEKEMQDYYDGLEDDDDDDDVVIDDNPHVSIYIENLTINVDINS